MPLAVGSKGGLPMADARQRKAAIEHATRIVDEGANAFVRRAGSEPVPRPGYNADPNEWVRYAGSLEIRNSELRAAIGSALGYIAADLDDSDNREQAQRVCHELREALNA
jgi:hypothetical protein